ncbi:MAG: tRNA preQ1(34) S-adenosylmethionine ribosyltransferase-isomerase QueA [Planctomycetota bacterium]
MKTSDFDFDLPPRLIAQQPLERRDASRLMVLRRNSGAVEHRTFADLPGLLTPGDLLVLNDTRVVPARFVCRRATGGKIEGLFLQEHSAGSWEVMLKGANRCKAGEELAFVGAEDTAATLEDSLGAGRWRIALRPAGPATDLLARIGRTPLPPYIRRTDGSQEAEDRPRYQTVYADRPGAVAAPTAGLHFTDDVFAALAARGIETARLTLHVGMGTFLPVTSDRPNDHTMHAEWYDLSAETAAQLNATRRDGRRIVAVGTTSVRVLETLARDTADPDQPFRPASGWTDIFIYPPAEFRAVDALVTNFHLPQSTLLMLVAAFCSPGATDGVSTILTAYAEAVRQEYRFFSYGDAMLIS